jgi:hypothetical protein
LGPEARKHHIPAAQSQFKIQQFKTYGDNYNNVRTLHGAGPNGLVGTFWIGTFLEAAGWSSLLDQAELYQSGIK